MRLFFFVLNYLIYQQIQKDTNLFSVVYSLKKKSHNIPLMQFVPSENEKLTNPEKELKNTPWGVAWAVALYFVGKLFHLIIYRNGMLFFHAATSDHTIQRQHNLDSSIAEVFLSQFDGSLITWIL